MDHLAPSKTSVQTVLRKHKSKHTHTHRGNMQSVCKHTLWVPPYASTKRTHDFVLLLFCITSLSKNTFSHLVTTPLRFPPICRPQVVQCGSGDDHQRRRLQRTVWRQTRGVRCQGPPSLSCPSSPSPCLRSSQWVNVQTHKRVVSDPPPLTYCFTWCLQVYRWF